ncbi:MAG: hypothetical protein ACTHX5_15035 [Brevibacterium aurantiacum]
MSTPNRRTLAIIAAALFVVGALVLVTSTGVLGSKETSTNSSSSSSDGGGVSAEHELTDMSGNTVVLDEELPSEEVAEEMQIEDTSEHLILDRVGLDVGIKEMNVVNGMATPPTLNGAFRLRDYGHPTEEGSGTTYIVTHSVRGGDAPGNKLIDVPNRSAAVTVGDEIQAYGVDYVVEKVLTSPKDQTPKNGDIWTQEDDKLVIMTCLQRADGTRSVENVVIQARKA